MSRVLAGMVVLTVLALIGLEAQQPAASAAPPPITVSPKKAIEQGRLSAQAGNFAESLAFYDSVITSKSRDAVKYQPEATFSAAVIRLTHALPEDNPDWARTALEHLATTAADPAIHDGSAALLVLLDRLAAMDKTLDDQKKAATAAVDEKVAEALGLRKEVEALTGKLETSAAAGQREKGDAERLTQQLNALRADNRNIREQLARAQAELERKDAALRKIAGSIVKDPSR